MTTDERVRCALILTHNRPELLRAGIEAILPQVDQLLIFDNASSPPSDIPKDSRVASFYWPEQPPNIARMWNIGWDLLASITHNEPRDIAMLCDDVIVPGDWYARVVAGMRETGATAGCANPWGRQHAPVVKTAPDSDIAGRMVGWAYVIDGDRGIRADETMHWWWQDTSVDFDCRINGGMVMVGGPAAPNSRPGDYTNTIPGLGEQTGRDREAFRKRWGYVPW